MPTDIDELVGLTAGDGLSAMQELLESIVFPALNAPTDGEDSYWLPSLGHDTFVVSTDGYSVDPIFFPGGNIGTLAIAGCGNDLLASGARLKYLTVSLFLSPRLERTALKVALSSLRAIAEANNVKIVCGDTKVLPDLASGMLISVTGIGSPFGAKKYDLRSSQDGDAIIITGAIAAHTIAVLSIREGLGYDNVVKSDVNFLVEPISGLLNRFGESIHSMRDLTRGGLLAGLWEGAKSTGLAWQFSRASIPIQKEVLSACELLNLDPISLTNEGVMLLTVDARAADAVVGFLEGFQATRQSKMIGIVRNLSDGPRVVQLDPLTDVPYLEGIGKPRLC